MMRAATLPLGGAAMSERRDQRRLFALTRAVAPSITACELTHLRRDPIDLALANAQHRAYEEALAAAGCHVVRLPATPGLPDSVFVEDTAIVVDEVAIITRPGAESRRAETASTAGGIAPYRTVVTMSAPATLDGGDVLRIGNQLFVGASSRSNAEGVAQLEDAVRGFGYRVSCVPLRGCLHLKSAVTLVRPDVLLANPAWVDPALLGPLQVIDVDPSEPFAANALLVGGRVIHPAAFERTRERLDRHGIDVDAIDVSELAKAEGGVTCCSLVFEV